MQIHKEFTTCIKKAVSKIPVGLKCETRESCCSRFHRYVFTVCNGLWLASVTVCRRTGGSNFLLLYFNTPFRSCFTKVHLKKHINVCRHWTSSFVRNISDPVGWGLMTKQRRLPKKELHYAFFPRGKKPFGHSNPFPVIPSHSNGSEWAFPPLDYIHPS